MKGQVIRVISGFYDIISNDKKYRVRASGNLRNLKKSPVVGDFVEFEENGLLKNIYSRINFLNRPKVANIDQVIITVSLKEPNYSSFLLNKFLAIIEFNEIKPIILFTKIDLVNISFKQEYQSQGYEVYEISNNKLITLDQFAHIFKNKLSVFTGQTGVGKSTTINNLTNAQQETQKISQFLGRGKHTTRIVEIISWNNGYLIDTPGFSSLDFHLTPFELSKSYHDFKALSINCQFSKNCLHNKEKVCAIKKAVKNQKITQQRYNDYLKLLEEAKKWVK